MNYEESPKHNSREALTARLASLSPEKRALLEKRLQQGRAQKRGQVLATRTISHIPDRNSAPLSLSQQRLWFLDQLEPNSSTYNTRTCLRLVGDLNINALRKTLDTILERHEALRTVFQMIDGSPVQIVTEAKSLELPIVNATKWSITKQEDEIQHFLSQQARQPFDLTADCLLRGTLLKLAENEYVLLLVLHHIASDGWSKSILNHELSVLYNAFIEGKPSPLPSLPIQYLDFACWQQEWLTGDVLETQVNYWRKELFGAPSLLNLPTDRPRPAVQTYIGKKQRFQLAQSITRELMVLSQRSGATLYMTLLAALSILLSRYSGQEDIMIGSPIANRNLPETESLIGFFVNTLVLRSRLQGNPTFVELLERVKKNALEAYAHKDIPFEHLASTLRPERNQSHSLWFQVLFTLQNAPRETLDLKGLSVSTIKIDTETTKFDLSIGMRETSSGLHGAVSYNTDLFDRATILRMLEHFQVLLAAIVENPEQHVFELPMIAAQEKKQILNDWSSSNRSSFPKSQLLHQMFEEQVEKSPEQVAVVFQNQALQQSLTYKDLNRRANQLAHYLQKMGVGPDVLVGLCVERSVEMIIGLLAVLKAGGAYVPLDPHYPKERLAFMLSDAQISVLLTQGSCFNSLPQSTAQTVCLDRDGNAIAKEDDQNPSCAVTSENLAYVIYTSGSAGTPKGVMVQHDSIVNFTQAAVADYRIDMKDRILQFASISFDAAAEEIYPCLTSGGTLLLRTDDMLSSVEQFLQTCRDWQLTVLDLPTAYWQQIVVELAAGRVTLPESLRLVIIGGERVSPESVKIWQAQVGDFPRLMNTYGPTEGTVVATAYPITAAATIQQEVPIGKAIANVQTYILDRHLQPVPIGVPGELHLGGACLARGYLNRPELTAGQFISNPFSDVPHTRLYKTGDLVRYRPDGNLEFLGRIDQQVKIRGFRIELGEIETVLVQHSMVQESIVIAHQDTLGSQQLIAYLIANSKVPTTSTLRSFLMESLPEYMVPSAFICLDSFPLTPNGKVDRTALPEPDLSQRNLENEFVAPRNLLEEQIGQIWCDVLKLEKIGIYDNFFELGGHSLLATQMMSRINEKFELNLLLRNIFEAPTIADLGNRITTLLQMQGTYQTSSNEDLEEGEL